MTDSDERESKPSLPSEGDRPRPESLASRPPRARRSRMRRRSLGQSGSAEERQRLDAQGRERPAFLLEMPAELEQLAGAFERGDYASVQREARRLLLSPEPRVRDAAQFLLERTKPDPLVKYLLIAAVALLSFLVFYAYKNPPH